MSDLDAAWITEALARLGGRVGPVTVLAATASTNDDVRRLASAGAPHGTAVLADTQSAGRGRGSHRWHSPPGDGLYVSLLWRPSLAPSRLSLLALAVGVGVARAVDAHLLTPRARIKWPNDVYVDDRKIAGVLVEASVGAHATLAVIGVGLNVRTPSFPEEIAAIATSLALAGARDLERNRVAVDVLISIEDACRELEESSNAASRSTVLDELRVRDWLSGRAVSVGDVSGVAQGIDDEGRLLVRRPDGTIGAVVSGEVSLGAVER